MPVGPLVPAWRLAGQRDPRRGWSKSVWIWRFPALCADVIAFFFSACGGGVGRAVGVLRQAAPVGYQGNRGASHLDPLLFCFAGSLGKFFLGRFADGGCCPFGWLDQRKLAQRSERVKSVDLHPTEPW